MPWGCPGCDFAMKAMYRELLPLELMLQGGDGDAGMCKKLYTLSGGERLSLYLREVVEL